jgi:dipeptidyl aminopeptidase/acylaminoacyl peptidase
MQSVMPSRIATTLAILFSLIAGSAAIAQTTTRSTSSTADAGIEVYKASVNPHWLDPTHFWYRNDLRSGAREFVLVDAEKGARVAAFDHAQLARALSIKIGQAFSADNLPVDIAAADASSFTIVIRGVAWKVDRSTYELNEAEAANVTTQPTIASRPRGRRGGDANDEAASQRRMTSPDGRQTIVLRDHNVYLREANADSEPKPLSKDGTEALPYDRVFWSPDSKHVVAYRVEGGDHKPVFRIESSPRGANEVGDGRVKRPVLHQDEYALPGDRLDSFELNLFDVDTTEHIKPAVDRIDADEWGSHPNPSVRWRPDGRHFLYEKYDRGHQRVRVIEVDASSGEARAVLDEKSDTFIWTAHIENLRLQLFNYLSNGKELIYVSERNGWRHLYRVNLDAGTMTPITSGEWVLRGIDRIDEDKQQIWFNACGVYPDQDPYLLHYGRVNFDGSGLTWLTSSNGNHRINFEQGESSFSPDGQFFVVTHSRVDSPPATELRRASDGKLVCELERAEVADGWLPPEVFVAKGRDDKTDIWGIIVRPKDFDPNKKYPIIEDIYAGPQSAYVPKTFSARSRYEDLANLGFIVVKLDGMGTANRSKAFHDVCWKNLADAGFPDRIKWIDTAAEKYPYMDTSRVGIYGGSAGGQSAAGALLFHGDFYKVAVANCGCHDNRMDKISWNEQWMGYPVGPQYSACSNIDNASKLKGRLQLVLGELDSNVPVESTYRFVDALVKQKKEFEFVLIPGANHGADSPITKRKLRDFFVRYLQDVEPANPNQ